MKNWKLWMAVIVGIAVGFACANAISAQQTKPVPGYVVGEMDITDPVAYEQYAAESSAIVAAHGGEYLIRGGKVTPLEGEPPKRFVVIQYESVKKALEWYNSPEYVAARTIRQKAAKSHLFIVEGVAK